MVLLEREINCSKQDTVLTALHCSFFPWFVSALCDHCIKSLSVIYATIASSHCQ